MNLIGTCVNFFVIFFFLLSTAVHAQLAESYPNSVELEEIVRNAPFQNLDADKNNIQLIYGHVKTDQTGNKTVDLSYFGLDSERYFYPASLVKWPVLLLAMEWVNEHKTDGITIDSRFSFVSPYDCHKSIATSKEAIDRITISNLVKKILLVSDNSSYNILFQLLGQEYIRTKLKEKGYRKTSIIKCFASCGLEAERVSPETIFFDRNGKEICRKPANIDTISIAHLSIDACVGKSQIRNKQIVEEPLDLSDNNYLPLDEGLDMMIRFIYPEIYPDSESWNLTDEQRNLIMRYLSIYPRESGIPKYSSYKKYPDGYKKYFMYGYAKTDRLSDTLRMHNMVGLSYGFASDIAFFYNKEKGVAFFLAGTIYANEDGVINDGIYNYNDLSFPFYTYVGQAIYRKELELLRGIK